MLLHPFHTPGQAIYFKKLKSVSVILGTELAKNWKVHVILLTSRVRASEGQFSFERLSEGFPLLCCTSALLSHVLPSLNNTSVTENLHFFCIRRGHEPNLFRLKRFQEPHAALPHPGTSQSQPQDIPTILSNRRRASSLMTRPKKSHHDNGFATEATIKIKHFRRGAPSNGGNTRFWQRCLLTAQELLQGEKGRTNCKNSTWVHLWMGLIGWVAGPDWVGPWELVEIPCTKQYKEAPRNKFLPGTPQGLFSQLFAIIWVLNIPKMPCQKTLTSIAQSLSPYRAQKPRKPKSAF